MHENKTRIYIVFNYIHIKKYKIFFLCTFFIFNLFDQSSFKMEPDIPLNPENLNMY